MQRILEAIRFDAKGLVPVIAQDVATGQVLMLAWADAEAIGKTLETGEAHYFSRSRQRLWKKGEASGNIQRIQEVRLDCDGDAVLYVVEQVGGIACHTGHASCFFRRAESRQWTAVDPVIKSEAELYGTKA